MDRHRFFKNLCIAAYADGKLAKAEWPVLLRLAQSLQLPLDEARDLASQAAKTPSLAASLPTDTIEAHQTFAFMVKVVIADLEVTAQERLLLRRYGELIGMTLVEVDAYIEAAQA